MGFGRGIVGNPAGFALGCPLMLTARVVGIGGFAVGMGTGFGVVTAGTVVAGEGMIFPAAGDLFSAVPAVGHIAVHVAVLIGIGGFRFAVLAVTAQRAYLGLEPMNATDFLKLMREKRALVNLDTKPNLGD